MNAYFVWENIFFDNLVWKNNFFINVTITATQ